jgi:hypothetical protein
MNPTMTTKQTITGAEGAKVLKLPISLILNDVQVCKFNLRVGRE